MSKALKPYSKGAPSYNVWVPVPTVYTAQGFEFDYIGVIFGNELIFDSDREQCRCIPKNSHDTQVKRNNADLTRHLQNVYRVLMSRAHRGVYVYFMNKETEQHFRNALPAMGLSNAIRY